MSRELTQKTLKRMTVDPITLAVALGLLNPIALAPPRGCNR